MTLEETETIEGTILVEEVIATDQTEQELVLIDDSEKESLPIEQETTLTLLDKDGNKESIERIGKEDLDSAVEEKEAKSKIESKMEKNCNVRRIH